MSRSTGASLYDARFEHDACGVGFVARSAGRPERTVVEMALTALGRLAHRGAVAADGRSGDGAGIMTQVPLRLLGQEAVRNSWALQPDQPVGVAMLFLPGGDEPLRTLEGNLAAQALRIVALRSVPVDVLALGALARNRLPAIRQVLVQGARDLDANALERRLYLARKAFERAGTGAYVCSLSCRSIVYKALCSGGQLATFYLDLASPLYESAFAVFHQRYSTNTLPTWELAQPMRLLAHNGEINTLGANRAWLTARSAELPQELQPLFSEDGSDSTSLDEALELLTRNGRRLAHALSMLIVPAWEEAGHAISPRTIAYQRYHAPIMEPWDGPAALAFSDGRVVGAALDRNGLRPCRYEITRDGLVAAGSEAGLFDLAQSEVIEKARLGPAQMLLVDLERGQILPDALIREQLTTRTRYDRLLAYTLPGLPEPGSAPVPLDAGELRAAQRVFGMSAEDLKFVLTPMTEEGKEPTWSMGDDTPVPPLAKSPRPFYAFLRQRFAQVTNPPIDPLRETCVMSLRTWLGPRPALLTEGPQSRVLELATPILTLSEWKALEEHEHLRTALLDCTFDRAAESLTGALDRLCASAAQLTAAGTVLLLLSDRAAETTRTPIPMLLATGAVHQHLLRTGLRGATDLAVAAGDCWDVHHVATLLGCGAGAICPWLALHTAQALGPESTARFRYALEHGLRKVLSRLGISTLASYRGGQMFEVLGLSDEVVERCFQGTPNRIGGLGWHDLEALLVARQDAAAEAAARDARLPDFGQVRFRRNELAEQHVWQPVTVRALQRAVGPEADDADAQAAWQEFLQRTDAQHTASLRDLLDISPAAAALALDDVESAYSIVQRFVVSAMSLGALSPEAHQALTIAMNRLGARSNTGEGGEDPEYYSENGGVRRDSKIKQIASGRFGVTAEYLARADEIEIKIAQGSKPGEGGQLPGHKVTQLIARLRHTQPGVPLISPPPHHDIYSIEDLAQLIYDLKSVNPRAQVGVKLVAQVGVGTVAAGVAKADADFVTISGHSGGTGASPLSSIKHVGAPWELGLAETQQTLMRNNLRGRIRVRTDGGLVNARDIVLATLLGADEFGFGTAPLVALGCDMARQCHLNTCPTGIATQRPVLRAKFTGSPEQVIRYFMHLAASVRALLAVLGLPTLHDAVGRVDLLRQARSVASLDLTRILQRDAAGPSRFEGKARENDGATSSDFWRRISEAAEAGVHIDAVSRIGNHERTVGARLAGQIALRRGSAGLPPGTIRLHFHGCAGQSFGAFATRGMHLLLDGEANDYVGKGLSGGEIVLRPRGVARFAPDRHVILGNVALYGATSGRLFAAGCAGERFAVRNSGAHAVVEGLGDHGCEYMTGGTVVVLGHTGRNFGAGLTGGVAFVYDREAQLAQRINGESVFCARPGDEAAEQLWALLEEHVKLTGSRSATAILHNWHDEVRHFRVVRSVLEKERLETELRESAAAVL